MTTRPLLEIVRLGMPWATVDPFLFCVFHDDAYPKGNEQLGPAASLSGRDLGQDFAGLDGWRMYHGDTVPGFPQHPHRGFETVTIVRRGLVDHSDSLGATARFGEGDVQWLTAGAGIQHSEMFPLVHRSDDNPLELFQIWLNLPRARKFARPHFSMLWGPSIPRRVLVDEAGRKAEVVVVAGAAFGLSPPAPPPESWASDPRAEVAIWTLRLEPGAQLQLPPASVGSGRMLYLFRGDTVSVAGTRLEVGHAARLRAEAEVTLVGGERATELLLLSGRPLGEPVVQYGPFVMNSREEIVAAFEDYRRTQFGGWPWQSPGPVHARHEGRFARYPDGRHVEGPPLPWQR
jgi:redox-sensitive bicupin YhaK (pirin superfamily)